MNIFNAIKRILTLIFFPPKCVICGEINTRYLCNDCQKYLNNKFKPKITYNEPNLICISCFAHEEKVKDIIYNFKFKCQKNASTILSNFLTVAIKKNYQGINFDYISYVPDYKQVQDKAYNQSEILANNISENLNIPIINCLKKIVNNKKQHKLSHFDRQQNVKGVYSCNCNLKNKKVLLCDDIITTGATLSECAKELQKCGAIVYCATVSYTPLKDRRIKC